MTIETIAPGLIDSFVSYCLDFYGAESGIYPDIAMTREEALAGLVARLIQRPDLPFDGDTVDRELVRDAVLKMRTQPEAA